MWATDRARRMLGVSATGPIEVDRLRSIIPREDVARIRASLQAAAVSGTEQELEFRVCAADGSARWLLARGRWERDESSGRGLIRGVLRDITDQRRTQEQLEELRRNLAHATRVNALGQLASPLAHELRQPLSAISINVEVAQLLLQHPESELQELRDLLDDIQRDNRRAGDVIDRLHAMLRRQPMKPQPVSLQSVLADVMLLVHGDAMRRGVTLEMKVADGALIVQGDRVQLSQVLINLIMNAMDAVAELPEARRRVFVQARRAEEDAVEIVVADTGTGIARDVMKNIFAPFFTTKPRGMGMGLCVSRTIIEAHGGQLSVENSTDGGAIFRLAIPAVRQQQTVSAD